jgi:hypothetical protein
LISFSFKLVRDQFLIGAGVARVRRTLIGGRPTGRLSKVADAFLQHAVGRQPGRILEALGFQELVGLRVGKSGIGAELGANDDSDIIRAIRQGSIGTFNQVGQQAVGRGLSVAPTLTIRPGAPVRVMVTRDLILEPYRR